MDRLHELTNSLSKEEQKLFKKYLTHKSNSGEQKGMQLFNKTCHPEKKNSKQTVNELYGKSDEAPLKAYSMLRFRVKKSLEDFIIQQIRKDDTPTYINKLNTIARFLYFRKKYSLMWHYLEEAESIAIKAEEYELLKQVYQYMIEYAWTQGPQIIRALIIKERENQEQAQLIRSLNLALSLIRSQLTEIHNLGKKPDLEQITRDALKEFGVQEDVSHKASHRFKLTMLIKMSMEEKNEYGILCQYLIKTVKEMEQAKLFNKYNYHYKIELLNNICTASFKSGDFKTAEQYVAIVEAENKLYPETELLSIRSFIVKVILLCMTNRLQESVDLLYYLQNKFQSLYLEDDYFFKCINYNMATAQFHLGNINTSRKYLNELINHPKRVMSYDGLEGFFYCHATECLLAIEEGDQEYALYRIQAIERKYKDMLKQTHHERNNAFIKIIKKVVTNEQLWGKEDFRKEVNSFIAMKTLYNAGPEFISFNAWLYSKLENVPYNEAEYNKVMEKKLNA